MDTPRVYDNMIKEDVAAQGDNPARKANKGYKKRSEEVKESRMFDMSGVIPSDFLRTSKHLAPGNKLTIKLHKAADNFIMLSEKADTYKLIIHDLRIDFRRVALKQTAREETELYPFSLTELRLFPIPAGMKNYTLNLSQGGILPKQIIFFASETSAMEGNQEKNPFNFKHFNCNFFQLKVNDLKLPPSGLTPDFTNELVAKERIHLHKNTGCYRIDRGNCIGKNSFVGGATIFAFDLSPE